MVVSLGRSPIAGRRPLGRNTRRPGDGHVAQRPFPDRQRAVQVSGPLATGRADETTPGWSEPILSAHVALMRAVRLIDEHYRHVVPGGLVLDHIGQPPERHPVPFMIHTSAPRRDPLYDARKVADGDHRASTLGVVHELARDPVQLGGDLAVLRRTDALDHSKRLSLTEVSYQSCIVASDAADPSSHEPRRGLKLAIRAKRHRRGYDLFTEVYGKHGRIDRYLGIWDFLVYDDMDEEVMPLLHEAADTQVKLGVIQEASVSVGHGQRQVDAAFGGGQRREPWHKSVPALEIQVLLPEEDCRPMTRFHEPCKVTAAVGG